MPIPPRSLQSYPEFIRIHKRSTPQHSTYLERNVARSEDNIYDGNFLVREVDSTNWADSRIILLCVFVIFVLVFFLLRDHLRPPKRTPDFPKSRELPELPYDPYLRCTRSFDASLIAANEPSFKPTTIPPRVRCASYRSGPHDANLFQGFNSNENGPIGTSGSTAYDPTTVWDTPSTSTPNKLWNGRAPKAKEESGSSSPPAYPSDKGSPHMLVSNKSSKS